MNSLGREGDQAPVDPELCARCGCDTDFPKNFPRCPIIGSYERQRHCLVIRDGRTFCYLFRPKHAGPRYAPPDPYVGQQRMHEYNALPRDPVTGRPIIA